MLFNQYLINTGAGEWRGPGNSLFQKNLKDNSAAPRIDDMHLNDSPVTKPSLPNTQARACPVTKPSPANTAERQPTKPSPPPAKAHT